MRVPFSYIRSSYCCACGGYRRGAFARVLACCDDVGPRVENLMTILRALVLGNMFARAAMLTH
jgi:hypothetical protein